MKGWAPIFPLVVETNLCIRRCGQGEKKPAARPTASQGRCRDFTLYAQAFRAPRLAGSEPQKGSKGTNFHVELRTSWLLETYLLLTEKCYRFDETKNMPSTQSNRVNSTPPLEKLSDPMNSMARESAPRESKSGVVKVDVITSPVGAGEGHVRYPFQQSTIHERMRSRGSLLICSASTKRLLHDESHVHLSPS